MGNRRVRLCKACGRKFTPKNQKPGDVEETPAADKPAIASATSVADQPATPVADSREPSTSPAPSDEVIDHPRF